MFSLKPVLYILGVILAIIGATMMIPAFVDIHHAHDDWQIFVTSSLITLFAGFFLILSNREQKISLNLKQAILLTPLTWLAVAIFSALPFYLSELELNFAQALFESVSGITTTGGTVITGLDTVPKGILLWRGLLQYIGGLGIIAATLIILPTIGIGGMQIFRSEAFGADQKHLPRTSEVAKSLFGIYTFLCFICAFLFYQAGMGGFDAITHSFFILSNGGFANYDNSFAHFDSLAIDMIAIVFMILGALPFILYFKVLHGNTRAFFRDEQVRHFIGIAFITVIVLTIWVDQNNLLQLSNPEAPASGTVAGFFTALRYVAFNIVSIMATCGAVNTNYDTWGPFAQIVFACVAIIGGSTGSTSGGIKVFRIVIMFRMAKSQIKKLMTPHGIFRPQYDGKSLSEEVLNSVAAFFFVYVITLALGALFFSATGLDFITSVTVSASTLGNSGPGLGAIAGPAGNFASFTDPALYAASFLMLLGRLELVALLVLLSKNFWRE